MKEKRYIILEVECKVYDFGDGEVYLEDLEWQKLHDLEELLDTHTYGWVTNVSSFKKEVR